jgi:hypothetical protein
VQRQGLQWAADVATQAESRLAECEALIEAGRRYFTEENIYRLRFLPRVFQSSRHAYFPSEALPPKTPNYLL